MDYENEENKENEFYTDDGGSSGGAGAGGATSTGTNARSNTSTRTKNVSASGEDRTLFGVDYTYWLILILVGVFAYYYRKDIKTLLAKKDESKGDAAKKPTTTTTTSTGTTGTGGSGYAGLSAQSVKDLQDTINDARDAVYGAPNHDDISVDGVWGSQTIVALVDLGAPQPSTKTQSGLSANMQFLNGLLGDIRYLPEHERAAKWEEWKNRMQSY